MDKLEFNFSDDSFNRLFPFYILIDKSLQINGFGKSLAKICPFLETSTSFSDHFNIKRPHLSNPTFDEIVLNSKQLTIIECKENSLSLRGQFELVNNSLLFVGSPWFSSMHEVVKNKLTLHDFAVHDPLIDLLHVLNNQENTSNELKELLTLVNNQKNKLKQANKEINTIALFPMENPDPLIRIDAEGNLIERNPSAQKLSSFEYENVQYTPENFFKHIVHKIDSDKERWIFEANIDGEDFSFVCKSLKEGFVNIYGRNISEQKANREELKRLSLVASSNENGIVFTKPNGKIFWCNEAYLQITGFSKEEVIGNTPIQLGKCDETSEEELLKMIVPFMKGEVFNLEHLHRRKNGDNFWVQTKGQPVVDAEGGITQYFAMIEDITAKKEAEFHLIESNNRLASLVNSLETGIVLEDENRKVLLVNKKFCSMLDFEVSPESLIGTDLVSTIDRSKYFFKNHESYIQRLKDVLKNREPVFNEEILLVDGRVYDRTYIPIYRDNVYKGNLRSFVDTTIKKRYNESLQSEKDKYRGIIANMNLGLIEVDLEDTITLVNNSFCQISGYEEEELLGKNIGTVLSIIEGEEELHAKKELRNKGVTDSYELTVKNKKGESRNWLISGAPNYDISGNYIGSIGIHLDITDQKEQEQRLYLLSLIAQKNINSVVICDRDGKTEWVNTSFEKMSGYSKENFIGIVPGRILQGPETDPETVKYLKEQIHKGHPFNCEIVNYSKSGEKYWVHIQGQALYNTNGEIIKFFAIEENITAKKELESEREELMFSLAKTNKELEDYASIVSHDLKSPLRSIHSLISWIKEDSEKELSSQTTEYLSLIENKVEKMDHLIEGILTYSKIDKDDIVKEKINTNQIVQNIIDIIHIPKNVSIIITNQLPVINADHFRMQQLFQNLIGNAVNYIDKPEGIVAVSSEDLGEDYLFSIKDNGVGIDEKNFKKIFDTFQAFTTDKHSTGLGLSIVKKIVDHYNGKIWIESELGKGTTFFIQLKK